MKHIGIIMDGNRRWAVLHRKDNTEGYKQGAEAFLRFLNDINDFSAEFASVYAFSTENFNRDKEEVSNIFRVVAYFLRKKVYPVCQRNKINLRFLGNLSLFNDDFQEIFNLFSELTFENGKTVAVALGYGGIDEICRAFERMKAKGMKNITKNMLFDNLDTSGMPDVDVVLRYGGYKRLSNFLPLQSAYAELFFTDKYWPDYCREDILTIEEEYKKIKRNFGVKHG